MQNIPTQESLPQTAQQSVSPTAAVRNSNGSKFFILLLVVAIPVAGMIGYYFGRAETPQKSVVQPTVSTEVREDPIEGEIAPSLGEDELATLLNESCVGGKIRLEDLPFTVSTGVQEKYQMGEGFNCSSEENYAMKEIRVADGSIPISTLYLYSGSTQWIGMSNPFEEPSKLLTVQVKNKAYLLEVIEPGPFGMSDKGIWLNLLNDEVSPASDTTVRSVSFKILKNDELDSLVQEYGEPTNSTDPSYPGYVINRSRSEDFKQALVDLAEQEGTQLHAELLKMATSVDEDLDGIVMK